MRGVNKVILLGNVGNDPDTKRFPDGRAMCHLSLATSEAWTDKQTGEKQQRTEWHRVVITGKIADIADQYVKKGSKLYVEGQLKTRKWIGSDGIERYTTEIVVGITGTLQLLDSRPRETDTAEQYSAPAPAHQTPPAPRQSPPPQSPQPQYDPVPFDDDIPF